MCQTLVLECSDIIKSWCNHVITNCDCSGVESLTLRQFSFDELMVYKQPFDESTKLLLLRLAQKFKNVKKVKMILSCDFFDDWTEYFIFVLV